MACQASVRVARGWITRVAGCTEAGHSWGTEEENALFLRMFVFYFFHYHSGRLHGRLYGPCSNKHNSLCTQKKRGAKRFLTRGLLVGGPAVAGLDPLLFLSCRSGGRRRRRVQRYLGSGALALRRGWRLAERERPRGCWVLAGWGAETAGAGFAGCWVGAVLGRLWAAAGLERLGRKCCIACDAFCASVKRSANPSTAGPKRPLGGERQDLVSSSWTSGKNGDGRCWGAWRRPGRNHSSRRLREGSSGGDHSKPSSSTAFERTRKSSASIPVLAALGAGKPEGAGSVTEPDSSSASEATSDMLSSASSSSLPPNETRSLTLAEGRWSGWEKGRETPLCVAKARHAGSEPAWARSQPGAENLCPLFFPHRSLGGRKREGAGGGVALWKESDPRAQRGETDALAVRTIRASERGICMGFPQAGNTLAVTVIGVQGRPAWAAVTARH